MIEVVGKANTAMDMGLSNMGVDMLRLMKVTAPHDKGGLESAGEIRRRGLRKFRIIFAKAYARRWEFDEDITDRLGRHYKAPTQFKKGKKSRFMRDPAHTIAAKGDRYLKEASAAVGMVVK